MRGENAFHVDRTPADVFQRLSNPENAATGLGKMGTLRRVSGNGGRGTKYQADVSAMGRDETATIEVVEYDREKRIAYDVKGGPGRAKLRFDMKPDGAGTMVNMAYDIELSGMSKLVLGPLLKGWMKKNEKVLVEQVRARLEAGGKPKA
jgi:carbon monoxide dehydrogenase subunit G